MKVPFRFLGLPLLIGLAALGACGDDSGGKGPSGRNSSLTIGDVEWDQDGKLAVTVSVSVKDESGQPMEGMELFLETSRPQDDEIVGGPSAVTDATGGAVFHVRTSKVGPSDVKVTLVGHDVILGPVTVDFSLDVALYVGRPQLVDPGVRLDGRLVISDASGPLSGLGALVRVSDPGITVSQEQSETDASGTVLFGLASSDARSADLSVEVTGLQGAIPAGTVDLHGPTISGRITGPEPPGVVDALRVGLLFVDFNLWQTRGVDTPQEIASQAVALDASGMATYELELPVHVPEEHFFDTGDGYSLAAYMLVLYDDVGPVQGMMDDGDLLVGVDWQLPQIVFMRGDVPRDANYEPGYNMMFLLQSSDLVPAESWDDWASSMDMAVDRGSVPQVTIRGNLDCPDAQCDGSEWIVAAVLLNLHASESQIWQPGNFEILASIPLDLTNGVAVPFALSLPKLTTHEHFDDWSAELLPGVTGNGFAILAFKDINGDGLPSPYQGEPLVMPDVPWGEVGPLGWYLHPGFDWGVSLRWQAFHAGYALFMLPLEMTVTEVHPSEHRLVLDGSVEPGHSGYAFSVQRHTQTGPVEVLSGTDLDTGTGGNDVTTSKDISAVQPGDTLLVTQFVQTMTFVGYDNVQLTAR